MELLALTSLVLLSRSAANQGYRTREVDRITPFNNTGPLVLLHR